MYRSAIYVVYDKDNIIDRYVGYFLNQLKSCVDEIYVVVNSKEIIRGMENFEAATKVYYRENEGYDVGAFKDAIVNFIGIEKIRTYDEVLLINDSFFGPFVSFKDIFIMINKTQCDFWGASKHSRYIEKSYEIEEHLQSFFIGIRNRMLNTKEFYQYWLDMPLINNYSDAIRFHELRFTNYFKQRGYTYSCLMDVEANDNVNPMYNYCQYAYIQQELVLKRNFPFLKKRPIEIEYKDMQTQENWSKVLDYVDNNTAYDVDMIYENLIRLYNHADLFEKLNLQYVLQTRGEKEISLKNAIVVICGNVKLISNEIDEYIQRIKDEIKVIFITESKEGCEELKNQIREYEYVCLINCDIILENNTFSCVNKSALYGVLENLIKSNSYISNVMGIFKRNKKIGALAIPELIHADFLGKAWKRWVQIRQKISYILDSKQIHCIFSMDKMPIVNSDNLWVRRELLEQAIEYNDNKIKNVGYLLGYVAQSKGMLSGVCETAEYAGMNQINQQGYLNALVKQMYRQGNDIDSFLDMQKSITRDKIDNFVKKHKKILIYGTGKKAREYEDLLCIDYEYVISDGMTKTNKGELYLSQVVPDNDMGIIVCLNESNQRKVIPLLEKRNINYMCI